MAEPKANKKTSASKPIFRTQTPYAQTEIKPLDPLCRETISNRLVQVLKHGGDLRSSSTMTKSRARKRKRRRKNLHEQKFDQASADISNTSDKPSVTRTKDVPSSCPSSSRTVLVGFNEVMRHLEALAASSRPATLDPPAASPLSRPKHVAAVFLFRPLDDLIYSHLPLLCHIASLAHPQQPPTRLIMIDQATEAEVVSALHLGAKGQVSVLGLLDAESEAREEHATQLIGLKDLLDYVREHAQPVHVPWLKQALHPEWMAVKVDIEQKT